MKLNHVILQLTGENFVGEKILQRKFWVGNFSLFPGKILALLDILLFSLTDPNVAHGETAVQTHSYKQRFLNSLNLLINHYV